MRGFRMGTRRPSIALSTTSRSFLAITAAGFLTFAGHFTLPSLQVATADAPTLRPHGAPVVAGMQILAGSLHDHSTDSDGDAEPDDIARWEYVHHAELGLDFGALTDHSDFFPLSYLAPQHGDVWVQQAFLSKRYSTGDFSFLRGFEYTSDDENHLGVLGSAQFASGFHQREKSMRPFYDWISSHAGGGVGAFNHPSDKGALQWDNLTYDAQAARVMATIEIHGAQDSRLKSLQSSDAGWYWLALARGWTLGPAMNWDQHHWHEAFAQPQPGLACGFVPSFISCQRTLVVADANTPESILAAMRARRISATEHPSLYATLRGPNGVWQGSTVRRAGDAIELTIDAGSSRFPLTKLEIVSDNGMEPHPAFDGDNLLCGDQDGPACDAEASEMGAKAESYEEQHRRYLSSHGYAVRKTEMDRPPEHTVVLTRPLDGTTAHLTVRVRIPAARSPRPDGEHFFYAIVSAGDLRAWTAPIFTAR